MFRKNKYYSIEKIDDQLFLLPYGQAVAELKRGFRINETSLLLWEKLDETDNREELIECLVNQLGADPDDAGKDVDDFIEQLLIYKVINKEPEESYEPYKTLYIADTGLGLYGDPVYFDHEELKDFEKEIKDPEIRFRVKIDFPEFVSTIVIIRNSEMIVEENDEMFILRYPKEKNIREVRISKNDNEAIAYVRGVDSDDELKKIADCLYNALRTFFLYHVSRKGYYAIHSASILYKDKAWLFSGMSGAGKSTHTGLWKELYDVKLINGDINLVAVRDDKAYTYGTPWCGTSKIYNSKTYEVGGIVFLTKDDKDHIEELDQASQGLIISQRIITPCWKKDMLRKNLDFANELKKHILVCRLHCTAKPSAVEAIRQRIDESL